MNIEQSQPPITILSALEKGFLGVSYIAQDNNEKTVVAKVMVKNEYSQLRVLPRMQTQLQVLQTLDPHPNIVPILQCFENDKEINIIYPYYEEGNLKQRLQNSNLSLPEIFEIFIQITNGLQFLHSKGFLFRNFKLENIIITQNIAKITDYGIASVIEEELKKNQFCFIDIGQIHFLSPQVLKRETYTYKADIWSLGVLFYYILFKKFPFQHGNEKVCKMIIINHDVGFPATINEEMKDLILKMLHKEEDERIEIEEILLRLNHLK